MHIHILGICGTFMAGIASLAKSLGHHVTGSDQHVYPPMSTQLEQLGITLLEGFDASHLNPKPDVVIVGNALSRGVPAVEYMLDANIPYISGPQWLAENLLKDRFVIAVSGTHGKTTTTSMVAWILEYADCSPGFLIGGIPQNFGISARLGKQPYFVIEADEYDTAFYDKRSKFLHYHPRALVMNNLEYDHADIFPDVAAIKQQFQWLVRTVPKSGLLICPKDDENIDDVLKKGGWTPVEYFDADTACWHAENKSPEGGRFDVYYQNTYQGTLTWSLLGDHNVKNALAALAAAHHAGVSINKGIAALSEFRSVKRRLEVIGQVHGITVYDDFAHHPTAIATTLAGLRQKVGSSKIIAVVELGSFTMKKGVHKDHLAPALKEADSVLIAEPKGNEWNIHDIVSQLQIPSQVCATVDDIIQQLAKQASSGDHILIMSNKGFDNLYSKLISAL